MAWIDVRDVGELAARILLDPAPHRGRGYTLTGPEAWSFDEVAGVLHAALGRTSITYRPASLPGYVSHLHRRGLPAAQIAVQLVLHLGLRRGQAEAVSPELERLLGRPPRTLPAYVADHVELWARS